MANSTHKTEVIIKITEGPTDQIKDPVITHLTGVTTTEVEEATEVQVNVTVEVTPNTLTQVTEVPHNMSAPITEVRIPELTPSSTITMTSL